MRNASRAVTTAFVLTMAALTPPALAAGDSGSGNGGSGTMSSCPPGYVLKNGNCYRASSGVLPDRELYRQGRDLALAHQYDKALPILELIRTTDNSMVYTMRGFALRKLGRAEEGVAFYQKALAIDPDNVNTHEYLGEYYVDIGDLDRARAQLAKVFEICGRTECEQFEDLEEAIKTGKSE